MLSLAFQPSGPSGQILSRFQKHEVTRSIPTTPGWDDSPSGRTTPSNKFAGTHLYTWMTGERHYESKLSVLPKNTMQ